MVRKPCVEVKLSLVDQTKMITDANELARNAVVYGRGSDMRWEILRRGIKMALRLAFEDKGTGIPDLGLALTAGRRAPAWDGLSGSPRVVNEFDLRTAVGEGTCLTSAHWN
jgi:serine/threonine-protein kinase RsbT